MTESKANIIITADDKASEPVKQATLNIIRYSEELKNAEKASSNLGKASLFGQTIKVSTAAMDESRRATKSATDALKFVPELTAKAGDDLGKFGAAIFKFEEDRNKAILDSSQKSAESVSKFYTTAFAALTGFSVAEVGTKIIQGFKNIVMGSIEATAQLETITNRAKAIFAENFDAMAQTSENLAKELGRDQVALLGYQADIAMTAQILGVGADQAAEMGTELTKLAVDFGKAFNEDDEKMLDAIQQALSGNIRSLARYGVVLKENTLSEYAQAKGIEVKLENMTSEQRAILTFHYLMDKTMSIQEAADKSTNDYGDTIKRVEAEWTALERNLGEVFMPLAESVLGAVNQWIDKFNTFATVLGTVRSGFSLLGTVWGIAWNDTVSQLSEQFGYSEEVETSATAEVIEASIADLGGALQESTQDQEDWAKGWVDKSGAGADSAKRKLEELMRAANDLAEQYMETEESIAQSIADLDREHRSKMRSIEDSIKSTEEAMDDMVENYKQKVAEMNGQTFDKVGEQFNKIKDLANKVAEGTMSDEGLNTDMLLKVLSNRQDQGDTLSARDKVMFNLTDDQAKQVENVIALNKEQESLNRWLTANNKLTKEQQQSIAVGGTDYVKNLQTLLESNPDLKRGLGNAQGTDFDKFLRGQEGRKTEMDQAHEKDKARLQEQIDKAREKKSVEENAYVAQRNELTRTQTAMEGFHIAYVAALKDMGKVTKEQLDSMKQDLAELAKVMSDAQAQAIGQARADSGVKARATGGYVTEGLTLVGERGPELVSLPIGSYVNTNRQTEGMLSSKGDVTFQGPIIQTVHVHDEADVNMLVSKIARLIQLQRQGSSASPA